MGGGSGEVGSRGGGGRGRVGGGGGQGGCERRIEVFVKIQKKYFFSGGGGGSGEVGSRGGGVGFGGIRVDVNEELKFWGKLKQRSEVFVKIQKKFFFFWGGGGVRSGGVRGGGGGVTGWM